MTKKYQHLFFDLDHTLWDFEGNSLVALEALFYEDDFYSRLRDIQFDNFKTIYNAHNEKFWHRYRKGFVSREHLKWKRFWHTLIDYQINDIEFSQRMSERYLELLPLQNKLMPNTLEVLDYCREKNYVMHIITNGYELTQWHKIEQSGLKPYFVEVITAENSNSLKPNKEIFEFALHKAQASITDSLMIGDAIEADVLGAQGVGMDQVFFNYNRSEHAEFPTYEINDLKDLLQIV